MVKEAELHAEEDHKKRELAEARNHADTLIYTTQRTLTDLGDKVDPATKSDIETHLTALKTAMEGTDIEAIKQRSEELMRASHKLAEQMYAKTGAGAGPGAGPGIKAWGPAWVPVWVLEAPAAPKVLPIKR